MQMLHGAVGAGFSSEVEATFFIVVIGLLALVAVFSLLAFTAYAVAMYKIARNEGYSKPWLAFLPFVNMMMIPILTNYDVHLRLQGHFVKVFAAVYALAIILGAYFPFGFLIPTLLLYYGFYFIADRYSERPVIHMVLLVLTGGTSLAFQLYRFRNRDSLYDDEFDLAEL